MKKLGSQHARGLCGAGNGPLSATHVILILLFLCLLLSLLGVVRAVLLLGLLY